MSYLYRPGKATMHPYNPVLRSVDLANIQPLLHKVCVYSPSVRQGEGNINALYLLELAKGNINVFILHLPSGGLLYSLSKLLPCIHVFLITHPFVPVTQTSLLLTQARKPYIYATLSPLKLIEVYHLHSKAVPPPPTLGTS